MGDALLSMAEVNFYAELLVDMFCHMLGTIDGTMTTACAAEGYLQMSEASLDISSDMEINEFIDAVEEGEDFTILFKEVYDGLVKSCKGLIFVVTTRVVGASAVEYITATIA